MRKTKWLYLLIVLPAILTACCTRQHIRHTNEGLNSTLWIQTSTEYRMLATQAYCRARASIESALVDPGWTAATEQAGDDFRNLPPAIIVDIDETVLDTSAFQAQLMIDKQSFSDQRWNAWVRTISAASVPGARDFLQWAVGEKKIAVFYITNRDVSVEPYTRKNLENEGFPVRQDVDDILCQGEYGDKSSDKSNRRRHVCNKYRVILMAGDNLGDFIGGVKKIPGNRLKAAETYASYWVDKWIMLPNPMYGSWEGALYDFDRSLTDAEILDRKFESLRGYH